MTVIIYSSLVKEDPRAVLLYIRLKWGGPTFKAATLYYSISDRLITL